MVDFLISHVDSDQAWAQWIDSQLRRAGYHNEVTAWNYKSESPLRELFEQSDTTCAFVLMVLSPAHLVALHSHRDWSHHIPRHHVVWRKGA
ncbi:MAG: toll/interleukin-1 receptor domain-containing protein [Candidatus Hydrogenedentes bacterium]|nr:toll/interleukin-1 receptor domain-containing protein [Candidatus Hydrogenedentota bacterium]